MNSDRMSEILAFLTRRRGGKRLDATDVISYIYLIVGMLVMFVPILWLVISSFKPLEGIYEFPPSFLPYKQESVQVEGYDLPLPLYEVKLADGSVRRLAQISQVGIGARMIDPSAPDEKPKHRMKIGLFPILSAMIPNRIRPAISRAPVVARMCAALVEGIPELIASGTMWML